MRFVVQDAATAPGWKVGASRGHTGRACEASKATRKRLESRSHGNRIPYESGREWRSISGARPDTNGKQRAPADDERSCYANRASALECSGEGARLDERTVLVLDASGNRNLPLASRAIVDESVPIQRE